MTAAKVELGRHLFYDPRLSANFSQACASCHIQQLAFTDGMPRALGSTGQLHPRGAMSLANAAYSPALNWAAPHLRQIEHQVTSTLFNLHPVELGWNGNDREILARLAADPRYLWLFSKAFPDSEPAIRLTNVVRALACFVRTLIAGDSPYHRLVYRGENEALSEAARRGMRLFFSDRAGCAGCHDGFALSGPVVHAASGQVEPAFHNTGLYNVDGRGSYPPENLGAFARTGRVEEMGRFRAPSLINIARTAPYMHDGSLATLQEVVAFYAAGGRWADGDAGDGRDNPYKSPRIRGFEMREDETRDLIAFLSSLTDESFLTDPRLSNPF
jgi:cytochrome c peroxidase